MPQAVSNSSPLIHLSAIGRLNLLNRFSSICIPPAVWREIVEDPGQILPFSIIGSNMFHVEHNVSIQIIALLLRGDSHPRKLAKDLGISHTTVLRKLRVLLDGNVVDFRTEGKNRVVSLSITCWPT